MRSPHAGAPVSSRRKQKGLQRLIVSRDNKTLLGAVLVGDTSDFGNPAAAGAERHRAAGNRTR